MRDLHLDKESCNSRIRKAKGVQQHKTKKALVSGQH
ncbi:hypothetical protein DFR58_14125, partial [Anaerobacterium chartisolvens]